MKLKVISKVLILALTVCIGANEAAAKSKDLVTVQTAWIAGQEAFPIWYAKKQKWDIKNGMKIEMQVYQSGTDALQDFEVTNWVFGGLGAIPTMLGATAGNLSVVAIANDEANANAIMVRPNSPILDNKGYNKKYPNLYGNPQNVRGKTFWCTLESSAQYTLHMWLKRLNFTEKDVVVKNIDQALSLVSFSHGIGDGIVLWAPFTFMGDQNGWVTVGTAKDAGTALPIFLVANTAYTEQYEKVTQNFVTMYMKGVQWLIAAPRDKATKALQEYYKDVFNLDYTESMVSLHFNSFQLFDLEMQKVLLSNKKGESQARKWQNEIVEFFASIGVIDKLGLKAVKGSNYITPKFINMISKSDLK